VFPFFDKDPVVLSFELRRSFNLVKVALELYLEILDKYTMYSKGYVEYYICLKVIVRSLSI
jgi:hypothetical protein